MKVLKTFVYGYYAASTGDDIKITDENVKNTLISKGILEDPEKKVAANVIKDKC